MPEYELVVRQAFGDYQRGDVIPADDHEMVLSMGREHSHVVKRVKAVPAETEH